MLTSESDPILPCKSSFNTQEVHLMNTFFHLHKKQESVNKLDEFCNHYKKVLMHI